MADHVTTAFAAYGEAVRANDEARKAVRRAMLAHWTDESRTEELPTATPATLAAWVAANKAAGVTERAMLAAQKAHTESLKPAARRSAQQERDNDR